jgi:Zn-dependent metalloprotease
VAAADLALPAEAETRREPERGTLVHLKAPNLSRTLEDRDPAFRALQAAGQWAEAALAFVSAHAAAFRLDRPQDELRIRSVQTDAQGLTHVRLAQSHAGISVWGAEILVHLDRAGHVYLVQGRYAPTPRGLETTPGLPAARALEVVAGEIPGLGGRCARCTAELAVFAPPQGQPRLVYRVDAPVSLAEGWEVLVDARTGAVLQRLPTVVRR